MGGIFSEMFGQKAARGGGFTFRGGDGEGFDMGGLPVTYSLRVPFLVAARGGKQRVTLPDGKTLDIDIPEGTTDGQTLAPERPGHARHQGPVRRATPMSRSTSIRTPSSSRATTTSMSSCR